MAPPGTLSAPLHSRGMVRKPCGRRGLCAPRKAKHSWKSGGEVLTVWYVNEFLYSSGHAGTVCGAQQRLRSTLGALAGFVLGRQVEHISPQSRLSPQGPRLARSIVFVTGL